MVKTPLSTKNSDFVVIPAKICYCGSTPLPKYREAAYIYIGFLGSSDGKLPACRRTGFNPGFGRSPEVGNGNPLQYSRLENSLWTEELGRLQSVGSKRVGQGYVTNPICTCT